MKNKRPLIFLGLAILLALVVVALERPERPRVDDGSEAYFIPDYDSADVDRVEVEQLLDGVELRRDGENWKVVERITPLQRELLGKEGKPFPETIPRRANHTRVTSALGSFGGLEAGVLVSDNPEKESLYQVDRGGVTVRGFDKAGKMIFDVVVGKSGPDFSSSYIRRADEAKVFLVRRPLVGAFSPRADDWRDRTLWAIDPAVITGIAASSPKGAWEMHKSEDGTWKVTAPTESTPDSTKVAELVQKLSQLRAAEFADAIDAKAAGLETPSRTLTITYSKDKTATIFFGATDVKGQTCVRLEGLPEIFLVPQQVVDAVPLEAPK